MDSTISLDQRKWNDLLVEEGNRPLTWNDLSMSDIHRFRMEAAGRCYAANPSTDILLKPLRRVFYDYCTKAEAEAGKSWMGAAYWCREPSDPSWPSSVMLSDFKAAVKEEENYRLEEWEQRKAATAAKSQATSTTPITFASLSLTTAPKK